MERVLNNNNGTSLITRSIENRNENIIILRLTERIENAQNMPGQMPITRDDLEQARLHMELEPHIRADWLTNQRLNLPTAAGGGGNPTMDTPVISSVPHEMEENAILVQNTILEVPLFVQEERFDNIRVIPDVERILQQVLPIIEEEANPLAIYLQEDIRNMLIELGAYQNNPNRFRYFLDVLQNRQVTDGYPEVGLNRRIYLSGLAYKIFGLFSIFSGGTIAYLLFHISDSGSSIIPFLKVIFQTCRCLLLTGIPIRDLLFSRRSNLLSGFRRAFRTLQLWINYININPNAPVPRSPNRVPEILSISEEMSISNRNNNSTIINRFQTRILEFELLFNQRLNMTREHLLLQNQDHLNNVNQPLSLERERINERIRMNNNEIVVNLPRPLFNILNNLNVFRYIGPFLHRGAPVAVVFLFSYYFKERLVSMSQRILNFVRTFLQNPNSIDQPNQVTEIIPYQRTDLSGIERFFSHLKEIDFSSINWHEINSVLFTLGGF